MNPLEKFKNEVAAMFSKASGVPKGKIKPILEIPPRQMGDLSLPCFKLATELKKDPKNIADAVASKMKPGGLIKEIKTAGPYVNFYADWEKLGQLVIETILKEKDRYGNMTSRNKRVVIEYPAPNTNKPLHLGHLRNLCIGYSVSKILRAAGYNVSEVNLNNDRGIHICKSMVSYKLYGKNKKPNKKSDHFVGDFYVLYNKKSNENPELEKQAYEMLKKVEDGDKDAWNLLKKMNKWALDGFQETYNRLGIKHEKTYNESEYFQEGKKLVESALKKGLLSKDKEGNVVSKLEKYGLPDKIFLRADGTAIYATQDLFLAQLKYRDYKPKMSIYVVGNEQNLYFRQLFKTLKILGLPNVDGLYHLSYGMVYLPEGKMKSREGIVVDADNILDDVVKLARTETEKRKNVPKKNIKKTAESIGIGALRYLLLKTDVVRDMQFNPNETITLEGNTAPYIQYMYTRAGSIFKKGKVKTLSKYDASELKNPKEIAIMKTLMEYPKIISDAARDLKPHYVANYAYKLATEFSNFYEAVPVLNSDKKNARLALISAVQIVIKNALNLLGIDVVERM